LIGLARAARKTGPARTLLRRAAGDARRARLPYEAALARFEAAKRAVPNKSAYGLLARFGISAETAASWKDVP
jgi:hypothetical protein